MPIACATASRDRSTKQVACSAPSPKPASFSEEHSGRVGAAVVRRRDETQDLRDQIVDVNVAKRRRRLAVTERRPRREKARSRLTVSGGPRAPTSGASRGTVRLHLSPPATERG